MRARFIRIPAITAIFVLILTISGCNALKRGDFFKKSDDTLYFTEIGFLMADNPGLSRDAITDVNSFEPDILITVPYGADTTSPLIINYDVVGKDTIVEYENPPLSGTFLPLVSGVTALTFNIGASPQEQRLRISKQDTAGMGSDSREFTIHVDKIIRPVLFNPPLSGEAGPFTGANAFRFTLVDEDGTVIPNINAGTWTPDQSHVGWDGWRMEVLGSVYDAGPPEGYLTDVKLFFPGDHWIELQNGIFTDANGYSSQYAWLDFNYDPPPVYLSQSGNDANNGLTPITPVKTWPKAYAIAETNSIFDIYIEASNTPYDTAGANLITGTAPLHPNWPVSIFGNWKPGFDGRYEEDWDSRPPTILTNSTQGNGGNLQATTSVLTYYNVSSDFVLDGVSLQPSNVVDYGTALMTEWSGLRVENCQFYTPQGGSGNAIAVNITDVSGPSDVQFRESVFIGKAGGSKESTGLRVNGSYVSLDSCFILAGDLNDNTSGISKGITSSNSSIDIWGSYILAGMLDPDNNSFEEAENYGIDAMDTDLNLNHVWIHSTDSNTLSRGLSFNVSAGGGKNTWINESTIISGQSGDSTSVQVDNLDPGSGIHLFNSVLLAGSSSSGDSVGINFTNAKDSQIMGNAIHVSNGTLGSYGIHFITDSGNGSDIRNNLVWSTKSNQTLGIKFDVPNPTNMDIRHNNFWNTDGAAFLDMGSGAISIAQAHATTTYVFGNIGIPTTIDIEYDYATEQIHQEDVGKVIGTPPLDVKFGGEDLSGIPEYPEDSPGDKRDRQWNTRTGYTGVGWSIGPYEYDNGAFPQIIYVSTIGDDSHPLGTREAPFASLARAYDIARTVGQPRTDVTEIRMALGSYDLTSPNMPAVNTGPDIRILGGYALPSWSRNPAVNTTELRRNDGNTVLVFDSASIGPETLLDGFTLSDNSNIAGITKTLEISGGARPEIRNNVIVGGDSTNTYAIDITGGAAPSITGNKILGGTNTGTVGIHITGWSNPKILANHIFGGTASNINTGLYIESSGADIFNNVIHAGEAVGALGSTCGINFWSNDGSGAANPVRVFNNTVFGGSGGLNTTGISSNDDNIFIFNNLLIAGNPGTGNAKGISMLTDPPTEVSNNLILFGPAAGNRHASTILAIVFDDPANMENELTLTYGKTASGNLMDGTNNPDTYFFNYVPAMTAAGFLAENWHLTASGPENARYGGQDLSGDFNVDKDGNTRTAPWSIGAYEY